MPIKALVRTLMDIQDVKVWETLLKLTRQYFRHIFWSLWKKISSKNSVLVLSKILRLFVTILTPDDKNSLSVKASVKRKKSIYNYLQIEKHFLNFFLLFPSLHQILNNFLKKMILRGEFFSHYRLQKAGLLKCLKSPVSKHLWKSRC